MSKSSKIIKLKPESETEEEEEEDDEIPIVKQREMKSMKNKKYSSSYQVTPQSYKFNYFAD